MLSDSEILEEIKKGNIVIEPFRREQLNSNSYDVRLGEYYAVEFPYSQVLDPYDKELVEKHWRIKKATDRIVIHSGETILAHTQEIIGGRNNIASKMNARSSLGRLGISVCKCAGFGDVGFINKWTMEITNHLPSTSIVLHVGMRVAQISFFRVGYVLEEYKGKYGQGEWKPEDMTPKLWEDWELHNPKYNDLIRR
ncbi:MAG: dCTP deaminase, dUMP-forming [Methanophagales virus GBV301]|uniref:dCTP deaminase, dUMP-forming n=1 Tax=Methanophagales virus GBV301 TaxID=2999280 RepID=A0A9E8V880_9CAUD|nr:MAG: dCTP deaminase, dUMP-forming [Methanophagales virus GBV301]WAE39425.1 MAG: dCTP deaminase, dUMP-forming [Methanophagales virus GBV301]